MLIKYSPLFNHVNYAGSIIYFCSTKKKQKERTWIPKFLLKSDQISVLLSQEFKSPHKCHQWWWAWDLQLQWSVLSAFSQNNKKKRDNSPDQFTLADLKRLSQQPCWKDTSQLLRQFMELSCQQLNLMKTKVSPSFTSEVKTMLLLLRNNLTDQSSSEIKSESQKLS